MNKFFRIPFATSGDKTQVPDAADINGNVSYSEGYGFDYQRRQTDPAVKYIERDKMNEIFFDITEALREIQAQGAPDFITPALNGGVAFSYAKNSLVRYSGEIFTSLIDGNTAAPTDLTKWFPLSKHFATRVSVKDFGAVGNGIADDTAAIQAAIDSFPVRGEVVFPPGDYKVTSLSITKPISLLGMGYQNGGVKFITPSATADLLTISATSGVKISGIYFTSSVTRTAGRYVAISGADRVKLEDFYMDGYYVGIDVDSLSTIVTIDSFAMFNGILGAIRLGSTGRVEHVSIDKGYIKNETAPASFGISAGYVDVLSLGSGLVIINHGNNFLINPSNGQTASLINSSGTVFDTASNGVLIQPTGTGKVIRADFDGIWCGENSVNGFAIDGSGAGVVVSGIRLNGGDFLHNTSSGLLVKGANTTAVIMDSIQTGANGVGLNLQAGCEIDCYNHLIGAYGDANANTVGVQIESGVIGNLGGGRFTTNTTDVVGDSATFFLFDNAHIDNWKSYTPTPSAGSGAFGSASATGRFLKRYQKVDYEITIIVTTNGTAAGSISVPLPIGSRTAHSPSGKCVGVSGKAIAGFAAGGTSTLTITNYDGSYPGATGEVIVITGSYEVF